MTELRLAEGEEVVKRYDCTAVDGCAVFAGTVIPLRRGRESRGTVTVTNRRVVYDLEASGKRGGSSVHQETSLGSISSVSAISANFGRDLRVPALMVIIGFILIFVPFVYATETDAIRDSGDYTLGYNDGVESGYYNQYLDAVIAGTVDNTIPAGYTVPGEEFPSSEYMRGFGAGMDVGETRAASDIAADRAFAIPDDLKRGDWIVTAVISLAVAGAVVFVLGSVVYAISNRTKDWVRIGIGSGGGRAMCIKSLSSGSDGADLRPMVASEGFAEMSREIGAMILENRSRPREVSS